MPRIRVATVLLMLLLGSLPATLAAQAVENEAGRWSVFIGGFDPSVDSSLKVNDPDIGFIPEIDLEDLALESDLTFRLGLAYELSANRRHVLEFQYLQVDRTGNFVLDERFEFGGEVFDVGLRVDSQVETQDFDIHYTYMVVHNDRGSLGLSAGVHALSIDASISGRATVGDEVFEPEDVVRVDDAFPLPLVGFRFRYELFQYLQLTGGIKWLNVEVDDIDGGFTDSWLRLEYELTHWLALGAGYARIEVDYDRIGESVKREIIAANYEYTGLELFARFRF